MIKIASLIIPVLILVLALIAGVAIFKGNELADDKHFSLLSLAFLKGDLFISPINLPAGDIADYQARQYLFYGPLPAIALMPAVFIFGKNFPQLYLSFFSLIVIYVAVFFLVKKLTKSNLTSFWLADFFLFGTVLFFHSLINISAYVVQIFGLMFLVLALFEYFTKRRWFLIGLLIAAAGLSRAILYCSLVFFILEILRNWKGRSKNWRFLIYLLAPIMASLLIWGSYNLRRFGSPFETGYRYNISFNTYPIRENSKYGLFNFKYLPANLYLFFFRGPTPVFEEGTFILKYPYLKTDGWGMAILFTSPLFLYLLFALKRQAWFLSAAIATIALAIPSFFYFGLGFLQFGYRYSLDFLPFLFLILTGGFKSRLPLLAKVLILGGIIFNFMIIFYSFII